MTVVGIARVKDEADIIESVVRHMLGQVDGVLVEDNASQDGTGGILLGLQDEFPARVAYQHDPTVAYYQAAAMTRLAADAEYRFALDGSPLWVVPFDADEIWTAREPEWGTVADVLRSLPPAESIAKADLFNYVATGQDRTAEPDPTLRLCWREQEPLPLPKVAARATMPVQIHQGNHGADYGSETPSPVLRVRHFPYRSEEQTIRKTRNGAAAYAATDLPADVGAHWRQHGAMDDDQLREMFRVWYFREDPSTPKRAGDETLLPLVYDPVSLPNRI